MINFSILPILIPVNLFELDIGTSLYGFLSVNMPIKGQQKCQYQPKAGSVSNDQPLKSGTRHVQDRILQARKCLQAESPSGEKKIWEKIM